MDVTGGPRLSNWKFGAQFLGSNEVSKKRKTPGRDTLITGYTPEV